MGFIRIRAPFIGQFVGHYFTIPLGLILEEWT